MLKDEIIDQISEMIASLSDPQALTERALAMIISLVEGRSGAVYVPEAERINLLASQGIDQSVLDAVELIWRKSQDDLRSGLTFYSGDTKTDPALGEAPRPLATSLLVVPVKENDELVALLYVDSYAPHFVEPHQIDRVGRMSRIVAQALNRSAGPLPAGTPTREEVWQTYLERTPSEEMEKEKMLLLLDRNEWNIARVARLMNVTRRTIYLRLQRWGIPREKVRKTKPRPRPATQ